MSVVVDVHTHMLNKDWLALLREHGGPRYSVTQVGALPNVIHLDGAPFMTPLPEMFDYDLRIRNMNKVKVDIAIISLTCPNVYWGRPEVSLRATRIMNDDLAAAQLRYPDRIRWFASLPWQYADLAIAELAQARKAGAAGIVVLGNIAGKSLTDSDFVAVWQAIDGSACRSWFTRRRRRGSPRWISPPTISSRRRFHVRYVVCHRAYASLTAFRPLSQYQADRRHGGGRCPISSAVWTFATTASRPARPHQGPAEQLLAPDLL